MSPLLVPIGTGVGRLEGVAALPSMNHGQRPPTKLEAETVDGGRGVESGASAGFERCIVRYGQKRAEHVMKLMLENYKRVVLIDTGAYNLDDCLDRSCDFACMLGLQHQVVPGSLELLKKLFTGPWDDEFLVVPPGEALTFDHFRSDLSITQTNTNFGFSS